MKISFIIPSYNTLELTKACLESLAATVDLKDHEVIIIDDGSTDGTRDYLAQLSAPFKVILNSQNLGYSKNCNLGARQAERELLCLCNSDLVFLPGWLPPMVEALQTLESVGIIGNVQRAVRSGKVDHLGVKFLPNGCPTHIAHRCDYLPLQKYLKVSAVTAACCLIRKDLYLQFDGLVEGYRNGFEDTDLCLRMLERGYSHYVVMGSTVMHHVSSSPGRKANEDENLHRFLALWKETTVKISAREARTWKTLEKLLKFPPQQRRLLKFQPFIRYY